MSSDVGVIISVMTRRFFGIALLLATPLARADTEFLGMFVQGKRIGVMTSTRTNQPDGSIKTLGSTKIGTSVLGQGMQLSISTESLTRQGKLIRQVMNMETGGRTQSVTATFSNTVVNVTKEADGQVVKKQLDIPAGAILIEDPTFGLSGKGLPAIGTKQTFYIFDPSVLSLIKNEAEYLGRNETTIDGTKYAGHLLRIKDPRANSDVYLDDAGKVILVVGIFGITMRPISRKEALGDNSYAPSVDLATLSRIVPDKWIDDPSRLKSLTLRIQGGDTAKVKNDGYWQSATRTEGGLVLTITPPKAKRGVPLKKLIASQPKYTGAALYLPSDDPEMKRIAKRASAGASDGFDAALRIVKYVHKVVKPDATIGMLRDAREVWKTKVGVCRDYTVLAATLMRAIGIPTKLVTGIVYSSGAFYNHAWVEAWDGRAWIALDPTLNGGLADATHIKFKDGEPEAAFVSFVLDGAKISIVNERR